MSLPPVFLLVVAAVVFGLMSFLAKTAMDGIPGPEVAFFRFVVGLVVCGLVALRRPFVARNWRGLVMRGLYGSIAVLLYFQSIQHLPVGIATLLNYTYPVFAAAYAAVFLGERVSARAALSLAIALGGVALVVLGSGSGLGDLGRTTSSLDATPATLSTELGFWHLVGLLSAVIAGAAVATIRQVRRTDGSWEIFAAFCAVGALVTLPQTLSSWVTPDARGAGLLVLVGLLAVVAQLLMTWALGYVRAVIAGVTAQLTPVATLLLGWWFHDDRLTTTAIIGATLTIVGVSWLATEVQSARRTSFVAGPNHRRGTA